MTSLLAKARNSTAYRSGPGYQKILSLMRAENVSDVAAGKKSIPLTFLTMCGRNHILMLSQCLASLCHAWSKLPHLHVISDGTMTSDELRGALAWWPGKVNFSTAGEVIGDFQARTNAAGIVQYAQNHLMGVKLAAQLKFAMEGCTLWCDNDVLWFRDFDVEALMADLSVKMKCSADLTPSYDGELIRELFPHLLAPPFRCAGINYLNGDLLAACECQPFLDQIGKSFGYFSEQTFIAELAHQLGVGTFSMDEIAMVTSDAQTLGPTFRNKSWAARHYVTPVRHLFWRDAFFLRMSR